MSIAMMIEWSILDSGWWGMKYKLMNYGNTGYRVIYDNRERERVIMDDGVIMGERLVIYW